ncbi:hypothetical protein EUGRSUZ_H05118 [Eucalyptus grandis]|uniref:Uncharacterized protein n=2 Tax=Eucalyptus grandis TaxID=71139 RepID=A0ACC3K0E0_EUCGR|nr:hypothetical protein EUGRSUZ_H05118 [Eucalyptus grandis]
MCTKKEMTKALSLQSRPCLESINTTDMIYGCYNSRIARNLSSIKGWLREENLSGTQVHMDRINYNI